MDRKIFTTLFYFLFLIFNNTVQCPVIHHFKLKVIIFRLIDLKEGQGRKDLISDILSTVHELGLQMTKLSVHHSCLSDLYLEVKARG